jgi:hypothetical protein
MGDEELKKIKGKARLVEGLLARGCRGRIQQKKTRARVPASNKAVKLMPEFWWRVLEYYFPPSLCEFLFGSLMGPRPGED